MQEVSALWNQIFASPAHDVEFKIRVNNIDYGLDRLVSVSTSCDAFGGSSPTVGKCVATQAKFLLRLPSSNIPKGASCELSIRLIDGELESEWIPHGTFFISTRDVDDKGVLTLNTNDAILKCDKLMYTQSGDQGDWPKTDISVVEDIAYDIGVDVDDSVYSIMNKSYEVQYPGYGEDGLLEREIMEYIGGMYGGNWIIDEANKLRLIRLCDLPPVSSAINLGEDVDNVSVSNKPLRYSRVTINVGANPETGEEVSYSVGDDTYSELIIECPWGTEEMANDILDAFESIEYTSFQANDSVINPAFQIGDAVIVNGVYTGIYSFTRYLDVLYTADVGASTEDETEDEYPYVSKTERAIQRKATYLKTRFNVEVGKIEGTIEELRITEDSDNILEDSAKELRFHIDAAGQTDYKSIPVKSGCTQLPSGNYITLTYEIKANRSNINFDMYFTAGGSGHSEYLKVHKTVNTWSSENPFVSVSYSFDLTSYEGNMDYWRFGFSNGQADDTIVIRNVKLIVNGSSSELSSRITQTVTAIESEVSEVRENGNTTATLLKQLSDGLNVTIKNVVTEETTDLEGRVSTMESIQETYYDYTADGMYIGKNDSDTRMHLTNDNLAFQQNGEDITWFSSSTMHITQAEVVERLNIGNWQFIVESDGSLGIKWKA